METNIFRTTLFKDIIGVKVDSGYIRVSDKGVLYDLKCSNKMKLPQVEKEPGKYFVLVGESISELSRARVRQDSNTKDFPPVGEQSVGEVYCEVMDTGISTPPVTRSAGEIFSNPTAIDSVPIAYITASQISKNDPNYDSGNKEESMARAVQVPAITGGPSTGIGMRVGTHSVGVSQKAGMVSNTDSMTHSTQETNHGAGMFTTSYNFLQHYFIHLAGAVSLPMNHMVNLAKMLAIGKFVKGVVGSKGKRVDDGSGTTKWQNGTGIYGLADEIGETSGIHSPGEGTIIGKIRRDLNNL
ncbi:MAG TPA: hypothetical protein VI911_11130 [Patescibacteria group bacterium]|nr:hypothetical protein [Patescibacteria group bacterium]